MFIYRHPILFLNTTRLIFVFLVASLSIGCATNDTADPNRTPGIGYGETLTKISNTIGTAGQPLFRFTAEGRDYAIRAVDANQGGAENRYLLIFENNLLVSVITADQGLKLWGKAFGNFAYSLPSPEKFQAIVSEAVTSRVSLEAIDFRPRPKPKPKKDSDAGDRVRGSAEMATWGAIYSAIMPWYAPVAYTVAAVNLATVPVIGAAEGIEGIAEGAPARRYLSLVEKTQNISLLSRAEDVFAKLGKPSSTVNAPDKPNETIHIFSELLFPVSFGFVADELRWIGYDYDAAAIIRRRKTFEDVMGPYHPQARALWLNEHRVNPKSYPRFRARSAFTPPILDKKSPAVAAVETQDRWQVTHVIDGIYLIQSESFQKRQCEKMRGITYKATDVTPPSCDSTRHGFLINPAGEIAGGWVQIALLDEKREGLIKFNPIRHQRESWPQNPVFITTETKIPSSKVNASVKRN